MIFGSDRVHEVGTVHTPDQMTINGKLVPTQPLFIIRVATKEEYAGTSDAAARWLRETPPEHAARWHFYEVTTD